MRVLIWGKLDSRNVLVSGEPTARGLEIVGLPPLRTRPTRDRLWSALLNSGLLPEPPRVRLEVRPRVRAGNAAELDLPLALTALGVSGILDAGRRPILAAGRLRLGGSLACAEEPVYRIPQSIRRLIVACDSEVNAGERAHDMDIMVVSDLGEACRVLSESRSDLQKSNRFPTRFVM